MTAARVPFANVDSENRDLVEEFLPRLDAQLRSGGFIGGDEVAAFERTIARLHGVEHAIAVNSGTDALRLSLRALDVRAGTTGITVSNTFTATVGAMVARGLRPLLVDVDDDENMALDALRRSITPSTGVVVAVHLRGLPARIEAIRDICHENGVVLLEDCAQAVLASSRGVPVGGFGAAGCFSLHPLKNLGGCGDGGVVTTDSTELARELTLLRNHGLQDRDTVALWGENSRLDAVQAVLLNVKLLYIEEWTKRRQDMARLYDERLAALPLVTAPTRDDAEHVYHRYVIRTDRRDELRRHLADAGVETAIHYPTPIHRQPAAADGGVTIAPGGLPRTEHQSRQILSLPLHPSLTEAQLGYVADEVERFYASPAA